MRKEKGMRKERTKKFDFLEIGSSIVELIGLTASMLQVILTIAFWIGLIAVIIWFLVQFF